jgi:hypothetical protein
MACPLPVTLLARCTTIGPTERSVVPLAGSITQSARRHVHVPGHCRTSSVYEASCAPGTRRSSSVCRCSSSPTVPHQNQAPPIRPVAGASRGARHDGNRPPSASCGRASQSLPVARSGQGHMAAAHGGSTPSRQRLLRTRAMARRYGSAPAVLIHSVTSCSVHARSGRSGALERIDRSSTEPWSPPPLRAPSVRLWVWAWREPRVVRESSRSACAASAQRARVRQRERCPGAGYLAPERTRALS